MNQVIPRVVFAAPSSGSGKTVVTCGFLQVLKNRGISCRAWKCGPDYIDPIFHKYVMGLEGGNLDCYFSGEKGVTRQLAAAAKDGELQVIEGVMGYYDGLGGVSLEASTYHLSRALKAPVVLVVDGRSSSLSLAAVIKGFLEFQQPSYIKGVILNNTSPKMAQLLRPAVEALGVRFFGSLPVCKEAKIESRHLGLVMPEEENGGDGLLQLNQMLLRLADRMEETLDIDGILKLAASAGPSVENPVVCEKQLHQEGSGESRKVRIGVARDQAFCFYYQENLALLEEMGAELVLFSPIHDKELPKGICGLILGGGYPELYASKLSANGRMREEIRRAAEGGMPLLAECGGFLYLHEELEDNEGVIYPMAGIIKGRAYRTNKLSRFGYIRISAVQKLKFLSEGEEIRGHEFHYWESTDPGSDCVACKPCGPPSPAFGGRSGKSPSPAFGGRSWNCIHGAGAIFAGFPHLYYPSCPSVVTRWLTHCDEWEKGRQEAR